MVFSEVIDKQGENTSYFLETIKGHLMHSNSKTAGAHLIRDNMDNRCRCKTLHSTLVWWKLKDLIWTMLKSSWGFN